MTLARMLRPHPMHHALWRGRGFGDGPAWVDHGRHFGDKDDGRIKGSSDDAGQGSQL